MERRTAAVALTAIIIVSVVGGIVVVNHLNTTVELRWDVTPSFNFFGLTNIRDAAVFIDFVDDPALILRYSYDLYPGSTDLRLEKDTATRRELTGRTGDNSSTDTRVKTFNITLGKYPPLFLDMRNIRNSTVIMVCKNNATLTGFSVAIDCDKESVVYFALDDDVNFSDEGMYVGVWANTLYLSVALPEGVNGEIDLHYYQLYEVNPWEIVGWHRESLYYRTEDTSEPLVDVYAGAYSLHLWLYA
ncbi:MAG: hypothetical protein ACFFEF_16480 [Candidatus Thorarchaeota archaeon]